MPFLALTSCASLVVASPFFSLIHISRTTFDQSASTASFHYFRQQPPPHSTTRHNKDIHIYYSHVLDTFRIRSRSQHLFARGSSLPSRVRHRGHQGNPFPPYSVREKWSFFYLQELGTSARTGTSDVLTVLSHLSSTNTALTSRFTFFFNMT